MTLSMTGAAAYLKTSSWVECVWKTLSNENCRGSAWFLSFRCYLMATVFSSRISWIWWSPRSLSRSLMGRNLQTTLTLPPFYSAVKVIISKIWILNDYIIINGKLKNGNKFGGRKERAVKVVLLGQFWIKGNL